MIDKPRFWNTTTAWPSATARSRAAIVVGIGIDSSPSRRGSASISACSVPCRAGRYTSAVSDSGVRARPMAPSAIASAAGPHW